jgi:hypothetical protein
MPSQRSHHGPAFAELICSPCGTHPPGECPGGMHPVTADSWWIRADGRWWRSLEYSQGYKLQRALDLCGPAATLSDLIVLLELEYRGPATTGAA